MTTDISSIRFVDASIVRVIEDTELRRLIFEVTYPLTENDSDFPESRLVFEFYSRYLVAESWPGPTLIIAAEIAKVGPYEITVRIRTLRGFREISCFAVRHE